MSAILAKEFLSRLRSRGFFITLWLYNLGIGFIHLCAVVLMDDSPSWLRGRELFDVLTFGQAILLTFITAIYASFSVTEERSRRTMDSLLTASIPPVEIALGKSLALILTLAIFPISSLPLTALSFFYGNLSLPEFATAYAYLLLCMAGMASIGIWISAVYVRTYTAAITAILFVIVFNVIAMICGQEGIEIVFSTLFELGHLLDLTTHFDRSVFLGATYPHFAVVCVLWALVFWLGVERTRLALERDNLRRSHRWQLIFMAMYLIAIGMDFGVLFNPVVERAAQPISVWTELHREAFEIPVPFFGAKMTGLIKDPVLSEAYLKLFMFSVVWITIWVFIPGRDAQRPVNILWPMSALALTTVSLHLVGRLYTPFLRFPEFQTAATALCCGIAPYFLSVFLVSTIMRRKFDNTVAANSAAGVYMFLTLFLPLFLIGMDTVTFEQASYFIPWSVWVEGFLYKPVAGYTAISLLLLVVLYRQGANRFK